MGRHMIHSHNDFLSFHPEEQSLGGIGDNLFLDLRHRIMTADFGPGRYFRLSQLGAAFAIGEELAASVARALHCHGYVTDMGAGGYQVKGWSDAEFLDALKKMRDSQRSIAQKYSQQMSDVDRRRLIACLDFRVSSTPGSDEIEAFYIRWWMFFHCTLHAYGMQSFRTLTLTISPPYLRRRLISALSPDLLNATFDGLRNLSDAFGEGAGSKAAELVDAYMDRISPALIERNELYNRHRESVEIDYAMPAISGIPVFLSSSDGSSRIARGFREPLNWDQFAAFGFDARLKDARFQHG